MRTGRIFATFVAVVMGVSSALVATPADGGPQVGSIDAQVLGQVEARGWESGSSDGRSTNAADPTSGLTRPTGAAAPTPTLFSVPTAAPTPTATAAPVALEALDGERLVEVELTPDGVEQQALDMITYDWPERLPGWRIVFLGGRDDVRGLTYSAERTIEVYVRTGDTAWDVARVIAHELGHAVDLTLGTDSMRQAWREQRTIDDEEPWWPGSAAADFATGAGDFAECFATWQVGSTSLSRLAGACTDADIALVQTVS